MKKIKKSTINVTAKTHEAIKEESQKAGMTQMEFLEFLVKEHRRTQKMKKKQKDKLRIEDMTEGEILAFIAKALDHLSNRNDVSKLISFIRRQEKELLTPMQTSITNLTVILDQVLTILKQL